MNRTLKSILSGCVLILSACSESQLNGSTEVSKCGENFDFLKAAETKARSSVYDDDNSVERLLWSYDKETKILSFMHDNLCTPCGDDWEVSLILTKDEDTYSLTSLAEDTSRITSYKCGSCRYDLKTTAEIEEQDAINLVFTKQTKSFDDKNGKTQIWSGKIDLTEESGEIVIKTGVECLL